MRAARLDTFEALLASLALFLLVLALSAPQAAWASEDATADSASQNAAAASATPSSSIQPSAPAAPPVAAPAPTAPPQDAGAPSSAGESSGSGISQTEGPSQATDEESGNWQDQDGWSTDGQEGQGEYPLDENQGEEGGPIADDTGDDPDNPGELDDTSEEVPAEGGTEPEGESKTPNNNSNTKDNTQANGERTEGASDETDVNEQASGPFGGSMDGVTDARSTGAQGETMQARNTSDSSANSVGQSKNAVRSGSSKKPLAIMTAPTIRKNTPPAPAILSPPVDNFALDGQQETSQADDAAKDNEKSPTRNKAPPAGALTEFDPLPANALFENAAKAHTFHTATPDQPAISTPVVEPRIGTPWHLEFASGENLLFYLLALGHEAPGRDTSMR